MSLATIIFIIVMGLWAVLLFLVIPRMILGPLGGITMVPGIVFVYTDLGALEGNILLASTIVLHVIGLILVFRSKTWKKCSLSTTVDGKMNEIDENTMLPGAEGVAIGRLAPAGKGQFGDEIVEVHSQQNFIDAGQAIVIVKVEGNKIIVKSK